MEMSINWFQETIAPFLKEYELSYSFFENGDFGDLNRVEFEGKGKGGNIDFWEKNWMEIHLYDYQNDIELMHVLLDPNQYDEKKEAINQFKSFVK